MQEQEREERAIKRKMQQQAREENEKERLNNDLQNILEDHNEVTEETETDDQDQSDDMESVPVPGPAKRMKKPDLITTQLPRNIIEATVESDTLAGQSVAL